MQLALFVRRTTLLRSRNSIDKYRHLVDMGNWPREHTTAAVGRPENKQNAAELGKNVNVMNSA